MSRRLHRIYSATEKSKRWFADRFTPLGKIMLVAMIAGFFLGLNTERTMIYQIFGLCFCALLFSFLVTLRFSAPLQVSRNLPDSCVAGNCLRYRLEVVNIRRRTVKGIGYREAIPIPLPDYQEFSNTREDGEEKRNLFDRKMGYYRWLWLIARARKVAADESQLPQTRPGMTATCEATLTPLVRGSVAISGYQLTRVDPFGLCRRSIMVTAPARLLVYPRIYSVAPLLFQGGRKYHQGGISAAQEKGDSTEFFSLREYTYGDPLKYIDWKGTARSGTVTVKQYRDEYFARFGLVLDSFTPKSFCELFEEAVSVAASILMAKQDMHSIIDLLFVGTRCHTASAGAGLGSREQMMKILAQVTTCRDKGFPEMTSLLRMHAHLLSGLVFVFIDMDDQRREAVRFAVAQRIPVKIFQIVAAQERREEKDDLALGVPVHYLVVGKVEEQLQG